MKKLVDTQRERKRKERRSNSVGSILRQKNLDADTALELVEVYEAVERTYRAAAMAGETHAGVAYATNYSCFPVIRPRQQRRALERQGRR